MQRRLPSRQPAPNDSRLTTKAVQAQRLRLGPLTEGKVARKSSSSRKSSSRSSSRKKSSRRKYGKKASQEVRTEMHHMRSGKHKVKNRKQAIAIGLSKARQKGAKVPKKKKAA